MRTLALAWRQLRRDLAAGDIRILIAALVLAVTAVTAVGFVTDRAGRALAIEANRLLGGDAVVRGDAPIGGAILAAAQAPGLQRTEVAELPTMIRLGRGDTAKLKLGELRALGAGFPLRGSFRIVDGTGEHVVENGRRRETRRSRCAAASASSTAPANTSSRTVRPRARCG